MPQEDTIQKLEEELDVNLDFLADIGESTRNRNRK